MTIRYVVIFNNDSIQTSRPIRVQVDGDIMWPKLEIKPNQVMKTYLPMDEALAVINRHEWMFNNAHHTERTKSLMNCSIYVE